ncbi:MAG TPA: M3 family metallopeptidase [Salinivirga sp.]|uniref:M3 family metallopeptidase n=1 Tax=Salinivirga sp. TaxID=1970192 RepID=UPI002B4A6A57|nr:M3 family metallopeptidase [Salinivirga sp.]HKK58701.1 M3 family metallopeptidase [Salinivirga sp.]
MKKIMLAVLASGLLLGACSNGSKDKGTDKSENPFFSKFDTPYQVPPFDKIKTTHYMPAFKKGMEEHKKEIQAIINNEKPATFENTIEALDNSGMMLRRVSSVFSNLKSSTTNDELQEIANKVSPLKSKHYDDINLNAELFERIKTVYDKKDELDLSTAQLKLLEDTYKKFVRNGANLPADKQERLRTINKELSQLSLKFDENLLAETNNYKLFIDNEADLAGLPESVRTGAAEAAKAAGKDGQWLFTLHKPSLIPFLQFSEKRDLREKLYTAYITRCDHNDEYDNKEILKKMVKLRVEKGQLMGFDTYAHYVLDDRMAKTPERVFELLNQLMDAGNEVAKKERAEMQQMINDEGNDFKLKPWDWWYYAEKLRVKKYNFNEESTRPYFKLETVRDGMFEVANKLWGLKFKKRDDLPVYHKNAMAFQVMEENGDHVGILYMDFFPRASKSSGAWMNSFMKQHTKDDQRVAPVISVVTNFSKPTGDKPSLLTFDEVSTLFHEFGHALHGLLSDTKYYTQSGTSVPRDFVELPSQIMENWAAQPEVIKMLGKHYKTGETIPDELIKKMKAASLHNQGFGLTEFIGAGLLDMHWHMQTDKDIKEVKAFENEVREKIGLIPEIEFRYRSPYFSHIFAGGYAVGYYGYAWAEILDADAFQAFKENGLFDEETAKKFRDHVLSVGGSDEAMKNYVKFRGKEPTIDALLERRGLN